MNRWWRLKFYTKGQHSCQGFITVYLFKMANSKKLMVQCQPWLRSLCSILNSKCWQATHSSAKCLTTTKATAMDCSKLKMSYSQRVAYLLTSCTSTAKFTTKPRRLFSLAQQSSLNPHQPPLLEMFLSTNQRHSRTWRYTLEESFFQLTKSSRPPAVPSSASYSSPMCSPNKIPTFWRFTTWSHRWLRRSSASCTRAAWRRWTNWSLVYSWLLKSTWSLPSRTHPDSHSRKLLQVTWLPIWRRLLLVLWCNTRLKWV